MAGVLATLVDMVCGGLAVRAAAPDWIATSDMSLSLTRAPTGPQVEARGRVIRKGRTTLIIEVDLLDAPGEGRPGTGPPLGLAIASFSVLPRARLRRSSIPTPGAAPGSEGATAASIATSPRRSGWR